MNFEWDEAKDRINRKKHGISFDEARHIFEGPVLTFADDRHNYGEIRNISIGALGAAVVIVVVHTDRDRNTRIISARSANRKERSLYYDRIEKTPR